MNETHEPNFSKAVRLFLCPWTPQPLRAFRKLQSIKPIKQTPLLIVPLAIGLIFTGTGSLYAQSPVAQSATGAAAMQANAMRIGVVAAVNGGVKVVSSGLVGRNAQSGEPIYIGDEVRTGENGRLQILLLDETVFTIGPNSAIVIDEFIYNPKTDDGIVKVRILEGVFRFITGKIAHKEPKNMEVRMPVGTIGVRGTMVSGRVGAQQSFVVLNGPGPRSTGGRPGSIVVKNEISSGGSVTVHRVEVNRPTFHTVVELDTPPTPPAPTPQIILDALNQDLGPQPGMLRQRRQGGSSDEGAHDGSEPAGPRSQDEDADQQGYDGGDDHSGRGPNRRGPRGDSDEHNEPGDRGGRHPMMSRGDGPPSAEQLHVMADAGIITQEELSDGLSYLEAWESGDAETRQMLNDKYGDDSMHEDGPPSTEQLYAMADAGIISPDQLTTMMVDMKAWETGDESTRAALMDKYGGEYEDSFEYDQFGDYEHFEGDFHYDGYDGSYYDSYYDPYYNEYGSLEDHNVYYLYTDPSTESAQDSADTSTTIANGITTRAQITSTETGQGQFHFSKSASFYQTHDNFGTEFSTAKQGTVSVRLNVNFDFGSKSFGGGDSQISINTIGGGGSISAVSFFTSTIGFNPAGGIEASYSPTGTNSDIINKFTFFNSEGIIANKLNVAIDYDGSQGKGFGDVIGASRKSGSLP